MTVTVTPSAFLHVHYDPDEIAAVAREVVARIGWVGDVLIEVDEVSPLGRATATAGDPAVLHVDSGAFEDTRRPRHWSAAATARTVGRLLLRLQDRAGGFAGAPPDDQLTLAQVAAWDAYAVGRLDRAGYPQHEQRWRYAFRNRHGFSDVSDQAFDGLWSAGDLTWEALLEQSERALAVRGPVPAGRRATGAGSTAKG